MKRIRGVVASFLIVCLGIVGVDVNFNESRASLKAVATVSLASQTFSNPTFTGTVTASQVTGIERVLAQWGVPCILASSGTMGNNGAVSGMTALPTTYSGGAWLYLPANSIDGSNAAGFYWFVASSTTAGTVYNSTWNGAGIPAAGTTTAFVSTGPGAFTGIATGEITVATFSIPAGHLGANGSIVATLTGTNNTAAGNKVFRINVGGSAVVSFTHSTNASGLLIAKISNLGVANRQKSVASMSVASTSIANATAYTSLDSTGALSVTVTLEKATATNHAIWDDALFKLAYGA